MLNLKSPSIYCLRADVSACKYLLWFLEYCTVIFSPNYFFCSTIEMVGSEDCGPSAGKRAKIDPGMSDLSRYYSANSNCNKIIRRRRPGDAAGGEKSVRLYRDINPKRQIPPRPMPLPSLYSGEVIILDDDDEIVLEDNDEIVLDDEDEQVDSKVEQPIEVGNSNCFI